MTRDGAGPPNKTKAVVAARSTHSKATGSANEFADVGVEPAAHTRK